VEGNGNGNGNGNGGSAISVTVNYQAASKVESFPRGAKVSEVLAWAITAFSIDDAIATEIELVVTGTTEELQGSKPLASLAPGGSTLTLDLVRGDIANGRL